MTILDIRIPVRNLYEANRPSLIALAKAGLKPAQEELMRRGELVGKWHIPSPTKHKSDWDATRSQTIDMDPSEFKRG